MLFYWNALCIIWRITLYAIREKAKKITVRLDGKRLEIIDYGDGIDETVLPHIWEKYYTSRQRGNQGVSGLGLAIVKQIAVLHQAQYGADSEKGKGSRFYIQFLQ